MYFSVHSQDLQLIAFQKIFLEFNFKMLNCTVLAFLFLYFRAIRAKKGKDQKDRNDN